MTTARPDLCTAEKAKKRWSDFTPCQRAVLVTGAVVQVTLLTAAQIDITRRPKEQIRGAKLLWRILVLVNFIGPIAYFAIGRKRTAATEPTEEPAVAEEPAETEEAAEEPAGAVEPAEEEAQPEAETTDGSDQA
jgi:hypothetical protein